MVRYMKWQSIALTVTVANLAALSPAGAQEATPASSDTIQEVVVTAQKRAESANTIPISITALGGDDLQTMQIAGLEDLTRAVPSVSFGAGGAGFGAGPGLDNIEIRGISSSSGSAVVGVYLDETAITVPNRYDGMTEPLPFDLQRVEILRGPQGTLYGASSMGGTIRFITNKPDLDKTELIVSGDGSGTVHGGANDTESAVMNIPIVPGELAVRAGVQYGHDSGWINNYNYVPSDNFQGPLLGQTQTTLNRTDVNTVNDLTAKIALEFKPNDALTITPSVWYQQTVAADSPIFYPQDGLYNQTKTVPESSRDEDWVASLDVQDDLGFATLTSVSSYFQRDFNRQFDGTLYNSNEITTLFLDTSPLTSPAQLLEDNAIISHIPSPEVFLTAYDTYSQEFRLSSRTPQPGDIPLKWTIGFYYSDESIDHQDHGYMPGLGNDFNAIYGYPINSAAGISFWNAATASNQVTASTFSGGEIYGEFVAEHIHQYAGFANLDYDILPDLHASAGLRYLIASSTYQATSASLFSIGVPLFVSVDQRDHAITPKASLSFDATQNTMIYATASEGYRVGGAAGALPSGPDNVCSTDYANFNISGAPQQFQPDKLWSYEAGAKSRLDDGRIEVTSAAYVIDWTNIQQKILLPICGFSYIANAGDAKSLGWEGEFKWKPGFIRGLSLGATGTAGKAYITSSNFPGIIAPGEDIPYTPLWSATIDAAYEWRLVGELSGFAEGDYDLTGNSHGTYVQNGSPTACATNPACLSPNYDNPSYGVLNVTLGVRGPDYEVALYAKNLTNDQTIIQRPEVAALITGLTVRPLTIGLRLTKHFGSL
jgi:iron complex outermembrane recepter protein